MAGDLVDILVLSTLAGLATGFGGLLVIIKRPGEKLLGFLMGLAAGIMVALSFLELVSEALKISGLFVAASGFVLGSLLMFMLDFVLPHRYFSVRENGLIKERFQKLGVLLAIGISLHNFPEGVAVALGYSYFPKLGLVMATAMALHNIPEGAAITLPMYAGGASRLEAVRLAVVSGLVEPLGAFLAALLLESLGFLVPFGLAFAGGVMVFVTLDELIPVAHQHGHEHSTSLGVLMGCIVTFVLLGTLQ